MKGKLLNDKCKLIRRYYSNRISMKAVQGKKKTRSYALEKKKGECKGKTSHEIGRTWTASIGLPIKLSF